MPYDNTNSGALFKNRYKTDGDKRPEYEGNLNVEGKDYRIAAWVKEKRDGSGKFMSLKISTPQARGDASESSASQESADDVPF